MTAIFIVLFVIWFIIFNNKLFKYIKEKRQIMLENELQRIKERLEDELEQFDKEYGKDYNHERRHKTGDGED